MNKMVDFTGAHRHQIRSSIMPPYPYNHGALCSPTTSRPARVRGFSVLLNQDDSTEPNQTRWKKLHPKDQDTREISRAANNQTHLPREERLFLNNSRLRDLLPGEHAPSHSIASALRNITPTLALVVRISSGAVLHETFMTHVVISCKEIHPLLPPLLHSQCNGFYVLLLAEELHEALLKHIP